MELKSRDKYGNWRTTTIGFRIAEEERRTLYIEAVNKDMTIRDLIRTGIENSEIHTSENKKMYQKLEKLLRETEANIQNATDNSKDYCVDVKAYNPETSREGYNRKRNITIVVTLSDVENARLDKLVHLSGLKKQEYILKRALGEEVIAPPVQRLQKRIRETLEWINKVAIEAQENNTSPEPETIELLNVTAEMLNEMKGE